MCVRAYMVATPLPRIPSKKRTRCLRAIHHYIKASTLNKNRLVSNRSIIRDVPSDDRQCLRTTGNYHNIGLTAHFV